MKTKNISSADSNHASELSDDALLDVFGGSTDYPNAVEAIQGGAAAAHDAINVILEAEGPNGGRIVTDMKGQLDAIDHVIAGGNPVDGHVIARGPTETHPVMGPAGNLVAGPAGPATVSNPYDLNHDGHLGVREAFEAAHDRFHQELDHVDHNFDSLAKGAGEIATAMVEMNPIVAGVHFLNDSHKKGAAKPVKK